MLMQLLGTLEEFERSMLRERTQAGLKAARAVGRPRAPSEQQEREIASLLLAAGRPAADAARRGGVSRSTSSRLQGTSNYRSCDLNLP